MRHSKSPRSGEVRPCAPLPLAEEMEDAASDKGETSPHVGELLALAGELLEQRRGLERIAHRRLERLHLGQHFVEADLVAIVHWPAAINRPAITIDPDDVDVARTDRLFLLQDLRALVDHRENTALEDLLVTNRARVLAGLADEILDDLLGHRRRL